MLSVGLEVPVVFFVSMISATLNGNHNHTILLSSGISCQEPYVSETMHKVK